MTSSGIHRLRVHLYGTQGSGSTFPSRAERLSFEYRAEAELLTHVFQDLASKAGSAGAAVAALLQGPVTPHSVAAYLDRVQLPEPRVYGGWTTCVWVETGDGYDIVLDCGSGFRNCARDLQRKWGDDAERHLHLFGSHSHLDHTEGFDQAAVCFDPRNRLHVYGNRQFLRALDYNLGIFSRQVATGAQGVLTPIFFGVMPATFRSYEIGTGPAGEDDGQAPLHSTFLDVAAPIRLGATTITAFDVFHPAPCLAYRIEHRGAVFVFCTDHELWHGDADHPSARRSADAEERLVRHSQGADLLYRDGQYLRAEYEGRQGIGTSGAIPRIGWGHSCVEDVISMATGCGVAQTLIGHHDPNREWAERDRLDESLVRRHSMAGRRIELARAETAYDL
jgi:ribonuclease BN (tRNA processing enzyme)